MRFPDFAKTAPAWMIACAVIGLIFYGFWRASDALYDERRESRAESDIHNIIDGFRGFYAGHVTDAAGSNLAPIAIKTGICSPDMIAPGTTSYCLGPWGADNRIIMTSNAGVPAFDNSIDIAIAGLDRQSCGDLGEVFATDAPGLMRAAVNGTHTILAGPNPNPAFTAATVRQACAEDGRRNTLLLTYSMQ